MVAARSAPERSDLQFKHGIPVFLDQVAKTLTVRNPADSEHEIEAQVAATALLHGRDLLDHGFTVEQVIRDYGDVCQAVTGLASETGAPISAGEFHTFNRCLDDAMAAAVTEYVTQSQRALADTEAALTAAQLEAHEAHLRSLHDSLTGLPNRELFDDRLIKAISLAERHEWTLAVMFLDLDKFKEINDAHGHAAGDVLLKKIAERLLQCVREEDSVCRNGGDEFLYLLMNPRGNQNIGRIAKSVLWSMAQPVRLGDLEFVIKPSIGVAIYPNDGLSAGQLIRNADAAMYHAKKSTSGVSFFDRWMMTTVAA